jgi:putative acetyltransferase
MFDAFVPDSPNAAIEWRPYEQEQDAAALAALFLASVTTLTATHYDAAQRAAWASSADDVASFGARLARGSTVVAVHEGAPVAFGQLWPADHVEMLYVAPGWTRRGLATAMLARLEILAREQGASVLGADASAIARPVFERAGFSLVSEQTVWRGVVALPRFQLCKLLHAIDP